jgi:hypothetical protein
MIVNFNYDELNEIVKCYITGTLGLVPAGDVDITCNNSDYEQDVTGTILVDYKACTDGDDDGDDEEILG